MNRHAILLRLVLASATALLLAVLLPASIFALTIGHPIDARPDYSQAAAIWGEFYPPADVWQNTATITTSVTVTDTNGLTNEASYQYSTDGLTWSPWMTTNLQVEEVGSTTRRLKVTDLPLEDGTNRIRYAIIDALGTREVSPVQQIQVDTQPPAPPEQLQIIPTGWQTDTEPSWTATWVNPDDLSGVITACYTIGQPPTTPDDGTCVPADTSQQIQGITLTQEGSFDFYLWLEDLAGNVDIAQSAVITDALQWDKTPPHLFLDIFGPIGKNDWYTDTILVNIMAFDGQSGLANTYYDLDEQGWQEGSSISIEDQGEHILVGRAVDQAGNSNESDPTTFKLDSIPPTTTIQISGTPNDQGWFETPVTITLQAEDATSGVDVTWMRVNQGAWQQGQTFLLTQDGHLTVTYYSEDLAGNQEDPQQAIIQIDRLPPITSYAILSESEPQNGWYNRPVTVTLVPFDEGIGVAATYYRINGSDWISGTTFQLTESGTYQIDFYSIDKLGHQEAISSIPDGVKIDTRAPLSPHPLDVHPRAWTNENDFSLLMALPPDMSGIAGAYVKVGEPPLSPTDGEWHPGVLSTLNHIQVPGEGAYNAYVWLQDKAGNVDHGNYAVWTQELSLKYDATPPATQLDILGDPGKNEWYTSPVSVTFLVSDTLSGPAWTVVSIDGGDPFTATSIYIEDQDKHVIEYYSVDQAGNRESPSRTTIRIDYEAPSSPTNLAADPVGWSATNAFTLTWTNPPDLSGIATAYYRIGSPPEGPRDGIPIPPDGLATGIQVPSEGAWDVYLWLEDRAGNMDSASRSVLRQAFRYDATPPTSTASIIEGIPGDNSWFISPVTILITPQDEGSGPAGVRYQINDSPWVYEEGQATITLDHTDQFDIAYQAVDNAGNRDDIQHMMVRVDIDPPTPFFLPVDRYQRENSFQVTWDGYDQSNGSGILGFDIQSRDGKNGAWIFWGATETPETSRRYYGNFGHRYYFRIRAHDQAGNISDWVDMPWGVFIDPLQDGDFRTGDFGAWDHGGPLEQSIIRAPGPDGPEVYVAQLGSPDYGPNNDVGQPGTVPVGAAAITQTIRIPGLDVLDRPTLTFWYRIRTYDAEYSERFQKLYDTLDAVLVLDGQAQLAFRDGQPYDQWLEHEGKTLADLGWRMAFIPIPRSMIDENIAISIQNWNRNDGWFNTWSQVTDVRLWEPYQQFLPSVITGPAATPPLQPSSQNPTSSSSQPLPR